MSRKIKMVNNSKTYAEVYATFITAQAGLAHDFISTYTRIVRTFLNWCKRDGLSTVTLPNMKDKETVRETYPDTSYGDSTIAADGFEHGFSPADFLSACTRAWIFDPEGILENIAPYVQ